jgi:hypothetical protein
MNKRGELLARCCEELFCSTHGTSFEGSCVQAPLPSRPTKKY